MKLSRKTKIWVLLCGDILALYLSLCVAIAIRYQSAWRMAFWEYHLVPFTVIFPLWIAIFYIAGLYDLPHLRNNIDFIKKLSLTLFVNALLTITIFYFVPYFGIAPKTNLFLFILAFGLCEIWWRRTWNIRASFRDGLNRVLLLDDSPQAKEVVDELAKNPQIGYGINVWLRQGFEHMPPEQLRALDPFQLLVAETQEWCFTICLRLGLRSLTFPRSTNQFSARCRSPISTSGGFLRTVSARKNSMTT